MAYIPYSNFLREVMPFVPGAPQTVIIDAIRNAAIDFCEQTEWLQYYPAAQDGIANTPLYGVLPPTDTRLAKVKSVWWDLYLLRPRSSDELSLIYGIDWEQISGLPIYYTQPADATQIQMVPAPQSTMAGAVTMLVALCPTRDSTTVDSDLYERWLEVICDGAKARLMATPQVSWSSMAAAEMYARKFRSGIGTAKIARNQGLVRPGASMRPPRFI